MNLSRNGLIVLISVIFVAGAGTVYAGMTLPMITLAGDVTITGDMTCPGCVYSSEIADGTITSADMASPILGDLSCSTDQVARWTGSEWVCSIISIALGVITVDSTDSTGQYTSLAVVNGKPAISYYDATNDDLRYVQANNADGTAWNTPVTVDATGLTGLHTSLTVVNGKPAISYNDFTNGDLKYVQANNADGDFWDVRISFD